MSVPPLILFEDEHLLVVNKPPGWNTHAPSPYAGEGLYDWLRSREPRWATLAIIHRLDKETSGILVFAKTRLANQSLTQQFAGREVRKTYLLLTDQPAPARPFAMRSALARQGDRYQSVKGAQSGLTAETRFRRLFAHGGLTLVAAEPLTGRTHQIRVQAAERGFPVLGDTLYGGRPTARLCLHAASLTLRHPATAQPMTWSAPLDFGADTGLTLRQTLAGPSDTNALRLVHGAADGWPGWYVDRLGEVLLSQAAGPVTATQRAKLDEWARRFGCRSVYHKTLARQVRTSTPAAVGPALLAGDPVEGECRVRENGVQFALRFDEGYSVGLFLDQRDNRRRLLTDYVAPGFPAFPAGPAGASVLNLFAYTCGFSVCTALAGARTTNVDLSSKHLEWGRRNFALNGLEAGRHEFHAAEAIRWLRRSQRQGRRFDLALVDPPTFSSSRESGRFQVAKDYPALLAAALPLVKPGGTLFAATNTAGWRPERFLEAVRAAVGAAGRRVQRQHYAPQPPDFPVCRAEPAYLKTLWLALD